MVPTKPATYAVFVEFSQVKQKIIDVENSIQATEATIQGVESRLNAAERLDDSDPKKAGEVQYLRAKEIKLRAEKAELRAKEAELRTKEAKLLVKVEPQFEKNVRTFVLRDCIASFLNVDVLASFSVKEIVRSIGY